MKPLAYRVFKWTYVVVICALSAETALGSHALLPRVLGGVEILGALLLVPALTRMAGLAALLAVYAIAALHHALEGYAAFQLALYAAGAWLIASAKD